MLVLGALLGDLWLVVVGGCKDCDELSEMPLCVTVGVLSGVV